MDINGVNMELGKLPPQNIEIEKAVLGAIIMEKKAILKIASILEPENFYKYEHQKIYKAIQQLFLNNKPIDLLTVYEQLNKNKALEEIGGPVYIQSLTDNVLSSAHIVEHSYFIKQKWLSRELIRISHETQQKAYDPEYDIDDILNETQRGLYDLVNNVTTGSYEHIGQIGAKELKRIEHIENKGGINGVTSGFKKLDRITGGWQQQDLIIIGARPSMGKTSLALKFAINPTKFNNKVGFFSLEMSKESLYRRLLSSETGIENGKFRSGELNELDWSKIEYAQARIEDMGIYIDDTPRISVIEFRAKAMNMKYEHNIDMIIVDYLQLMRAPGKRDREREIAEISASLKATAKELDIPIISLAQLSRQVEMRSDKRPQLSDLRESGSLEQDADIVAFIHRPEYYGILEDHEGNSTKQKIEFIIAKHRNGPLADFSFWRSKNWSDIVERSIEEMEPENQVFGENKDPEQKEIENTDNPF